MDSRMKDKCEHHKPSSEYWLAALIKGKSSHTQKDTQSP